MKLEGTFFSPLHYYILPATSKQFSVYALNTKSVNMSIYLKLALKESYTVSQGGGLDFHTTQHTNFMCSISVSKEIFLLE